MPLFRSVSDDVDSDADCTQLERGEWTEGISNIAALGPNETFGRNCSCLRAVLFFVRLNLQQLPVPYLENDDAGRGLEVVDWRIASDRPPSDFEANNLLIIVFHISIDMMFVVRLTVNTGTYTVLYVNVRSCGSPSKKILAWKHHVMIVSIT